MQLPTHFFSGRKNANICHFYFYFFNCTCSHTLVTNLEFTKYIVFFLKKFVTLIKLYQGSFKRYFGDEKNAEQQES